MATPLPCGRLYHTHTPTLPDYTRTTRSAPTHTVVPRAHALYRCTHRAPRRTHAHYTDVLRTPAVDDLCYHTLPRATATHGGSWVGFFHLRFACLLWILSTCLHAAGSPALPGSACAASTCPFTCHWFAGFCLHYSSCRLLPRRSAWFYLPAAFAVYCLRGSAYRRVRVQVCGSAFHGSVPIHRTGSLVLVLRKHTLCSFYRTVYRSCATTWVAGAVPLHRRACMPAAYTHATTAAHFIPLVGLTAARTTPACAPPPLPVAAVGSHAPLPSGSRLYGSGYHALRAAAAWLRGWLYAWFCRCPTISYGHTLVRTTMRITYRATAAHCHLVTHTPATACRRYALATAPHAACGSPQHCLPAPGSHCRTLRITAVSLPVLGSPACTAVPTTCTCHTHTCYRGYNAPFLPAHRRFFLPVPALPPLVYFWFLRFCPLPVLPRFLCYTTAGSSHLAYAQFCCALPHLCMP